MKSADSWRPKAYPSSGPPILRREDVRRAYGATPTRLHGYDDVLTELLEAMAHV